MTNTILTHMSLAIGNKLPGRIESPALERVKSLVKSLSKTKKEEMENNIALKFGRLVTTNVNKKLSQDVSFQVRRQWKRVNEQSNVVRHRYKMEEYSLPQNTHCRTPYPPLDSFEKNFDVNDTQIYQQCPIENLSGPIRGQPQQNLDPQNLNGFQIINYNNLPHNQGVSPFNPMWHQEFLQNNPPLWVPQNFGNSYNAAYANANGSVPHNVFENVPDILNGQNFHPNHETYYHTDYVNPGPGFLAFDCETSDFNFHSNGTQMPQPPYGRGHSSRRRGRGRTRSYERRGWGGRGGRGGITNPY